MKLSIDKYEYVKTKLADVEIDFPEEVFAFQQDNHRTATLVVPVWSTWKVEQGHEKEEIYSYNIVRVFNSVSDLRIITGHLDINKQNIESMFLEMLNVNHYSLEQEVLNYICHYFTEDRITPQQFSNMYATTITNINEKTQYVGVKL